MNKAQSEIIGLAFVMVIITLGLAILVSFSLKSSSTDYVNIFTKSELPLFLNNAMLETNIEECYGEKLSRLLMKCAEGANLICPQSIDGGTLPTDLANKPVKDACVVSYRFIEKQLQTVLTQNYQYFRYFVYTGDDYKENQIFMLQNSIDGKTCGNRMNIPHPGRLFFRIAGGELLNTKLDICYET